MLFYYKAPRRFLGEDFCDNCERKDLLFVDRAQSRLHAVEDRRHIQIAEVLYVVGSDLLKALAIKGLVMIEREFPHQFDTLKRDHVEKPTLIKKKPFAQERSDKSALDLWGGPTT